MPRVSVIIPTHNRPGLLPRAVASALSAGEDVEVVVVDDASADETAEVCRSLSGIRYVRLDRNQGVAGARNVGVLASTADFITFLDDDDVRLPGTLDEQAAVLESAPEAGLVYGQAHIGDRDCAPTGSFYPEQCPRGDVFWELLERNFIPCGSVMFRKSCVRRVGLLDKNVAGVDDWDMWVRIAELYPVAAVERPVIVWRQSTADSGQGSSRSAELIALAANMLRRRWLTLPRARGATAERRRRSWRGFSDNLSEHVMWEMTTSLIRGDLGLARKGLAVALRLHPSSLLRTARKWARFSTLRLLAAEVSARHGLSGAKARLKRERAGAGGRRTAAR